MERTTLRRQRQQSFDIVNEIRESDFHRRPIFHRRAGDADGANEQAHSGLLLSEDMLDPRSDF